MNWLSEYQNLRQSRQQDEESRKKILAEVKSLGGVDGEIARLFHEKELRSTQDRYVNKLKELFDANVDEEELERSGVLSEGVSRAYRRATENGGFSSIEALQREIDRALEDEEFMFLAMVS